MMLGKDSNGDNMKEYEIIQAEAKNPMIYFGTNYK
jgi:hypothetical protein